MTARGHSCSAPAQDAAGRPGKVSWQQALLDSALPPEQHSQASQHPGSSQAAAARLLSSLGSHIPIGSGIIGAMGYARLPRRPLREEPTAILLPTNHETAITPMEMKLRQQI